MRDLLYRFLDRRKYLFKVIVILSLVFLSSFTAALLPQLINPHILEQYLGRFEDEINPGQYYPDIELYGSTKDPSFINTFNQSVEQASLKTYGIYQPNNTYLYVRDYAIFNSTYGSETPSSVALYGISTDLYNQLRFISSNSSLVSGAILLTELTNLSSTNFLFYLRNNAVSLQPNKILAIDSFKSNFPQLYFDIEGEISEHTNPNPDIRPWKPCFFLQIDEFITLYDDIIISDMWDTYHLEGSLFFNQEQQEIIHWSIDREIQLDNFEENLLENLQIISPSTKLQFLNIHITTDGELINIIYSFVRGLQLVIWGLSVILVIISLAKIQNSNENKEFRILLSGQKWAKRLVNFVLEDLLVVVISAVFGLGFTFLLTKLQLLFGLTIELDKSSFIELGIIVAVIFTINFAIYVDFDFYLRRKIFKQSLEYTYRPFSLIPKYLYFLPLLLVMLVLWLLNRN
ncbi:MAG TPA: hypothetical protein VMZ29_05315, partial [Candidatus Bathyarchaeia archaeon]|nr:hypothetical protein [Candidatus Bathyarchaeia archaeon]